jgi:hypothetical protein
VESENGFMSLNGVEDFYLAVDERMICECSIVVGEIRNLIEKEKRKI